mgnify:CR=1 FL=1
MESRNDSSKRIRISLSITEKTHQLMKDAAMKKGTNMSQMVADWVWEDAKPQKYGERVFHLTPDTMYRLEQYACQNHQSVDQAVTGWIWKAKVNGSVMKGQMSLLDLEG